MNTPAYVYGPSVHVYGGPGAARCRGAVRSKTIRRRPTTCGWASDSAQASFRSQARVRVGRHTGTSSVAASPLTTQCAAAATGGQRPGSANTDESFGTTESKRRRGTESPGPARPPRRRGLGLPRVPSVPKRSERTAGNWSRRADLNRGPAGYEKFDRGPLLLAISAIAYL